MSELMMLARFDEVSATTVGDGDIVAGTVPEWCELVLDLTDEKGTKQLQLTRHDAEVIIEVLHTVLHPNTNQQSPVQRLWEQLDDVMDFLMDNDDPEPEDKARARALAEAIALISQPWSEDLDIGPIKEEAMERWENRQE